jgi:hypothetical protein
MAQVFTQEGQGVRFIDPDVQADYAKKYKEPFVIHSSELKPSTSVKEEYWDELIKLKDADGKIFPEAEKDFIDAFELTKISKSKSTEKIKLDEND